MGWLSILCGRIGDWLRNQVEDFLCPLADKHGDYSAHGECPHCGWHVHFCDVGGCTPRLGGVHRWSHAVKWCRAPDTVACVKGHLKLAWRIFSHEDTRWAIRNHRDNWSRNDKVKK